MSTTENPNARRAAILIANTTGTPEEIAATLDAAGCLQRPAVQVSGPYPLWLHPTALGVTLDPHPLVSALVKFLAAEAAEEADDDVDPESLVGELVAINNATGPALDALIDQLVKRFGGTECRYSAPEARTLAARLIAAVGPEFPRQQDRRAG